VLRSKNKFLFMYVHVLKQISLTLTDFVKGDDGEAVDWKFFLKVFLTCQFVCT
jgi:hypothetical protein